MGAVEEQLGNFQKALDLYEKALEIFLGPAHASVAMTKENIGYVYEQLGDLAQARSCIEEAHSIFMQSLGPHHHNTEKAARAPQRLQSYSELV